jgi:hypothetical protein
MKKSLSAVFFNLITLLSFGQETLPANQAKATRTILFVCEHGAGRSTIAMAYFNRLAKEQGLPYKAIFRGTNPDSVLSPATQKGLLKDSFDVQGWKPLWVSKKDIEGAYQVITLDCSLPGEDTITKPVTKWTGIPSISNDYNMARDTVLKKVQELVAELTKTKTN